jgi:hypothetical protein
MTSFDVYQLYVAIKSHFKNPSYNFFTYNGKVKGCTPSSFDKKPYKLIFTAIRNKHVVREKIQQIFVTNLFENPDIWCGDFLSESSYEIFLQHKKINSAFHYYLQHDLRVLSTENSQHDDRPILLRCFEQRIIQPQTFIYLCQTYNLYKKFVGLNPYSDELLHRCEKYSHFLELRVDKKLVHEQLKLLFD